MACDSDLCRDFIVNFVSNFVQLGSILINPSLQRGVENDHGAHNGFTAFGREKNWTAATAPATESAHRAERI